MYANYIRNLKNQIMDLLECNGHSIISVNKLCGSHHLLKWHGLWWCLQLNSFNSLTLIFDLLPSIDEAMDLVQCYVHNIIHTQLLFVS